MNKIILGLDLGTNSIGWALIDKEEKKILGMGSRIISMGSDKIDYEKGAGITKNADRRTKRTIRKMNKRYKLRRNKLLYILYELGLLPDHFQFKKGIPAPNKIQDLELLPVKKGTLQLGSLGNYELRANAIENAVDLKEFGKILYQFNQLRGYSGGNNDEDIEKAKEDDSDEETEKKKYEVYTRKVTILKVEKSDTTFKVKGGKNKGEEQFKYDVIVSFENEELEGLTELQNLKEKEGQEEELEIRIKRTRREENITFALPQKTNWRKQMEATEEILKNDQLFVSQLIVRDLRQNKWTKIRKRVVLRNRYQAEFDKIWDTQYNKNNEFKKIVDDKERLEKLIAYLFPERDKTKPETKESKESQKEEYRTKAKENGLKYLIKDQIIYYQRPLKPQTELIGSCQFEKEEKVLANSHPFFQEFRCWDQINRIYITSKQEVYNERKKKNFFQYKDRFLTKEEKAEIYSKLQKQKQLGFGEVAKIVNLKNDKAEYLNGLNVKAKLKGCDTIISIKKILGEYYENLLEKDKDILVKIWQVVFDNANNGSEYDSKSLKVSSITNVLQVLIGKEIAIQLALKLAQNTKFPRKYGSLSKKSIENILPLMQLNPGVIPEKIKSNFENVQHLIETGELLDETFFEDYIINFVQDNPDALQVGGLMYAFASSLVYGRHTKEVIKSQIENYHDIKQIERNLRNPIVEQIANETMQVVKAIWKQYKFNPEELEIRVELARDLKNSSAEREKIYKGQIKNQRINETIKKKLIELKQDPTHGNIEMYKLWSTQNAENYPAPKKASEPTQEEIQKLRLWEEQKCISPYTLKPIPLSKLFSPERLYDIDHIIPKSRYFDDSFSNKVVCETNINEEKNNRTAWEYLSQQNSVFRICSIENYLRHVNDIFYGKKKRNLLLEKIPANPVERQIKNTQYISVAVKNELAKIVGSDNIKTSTGEVTSFLRSRWGLKKVFMELTENRFKQMEFWDWNIETNKPNIEWVQKYYDTEKQKHIYEIKNWSKRYDHRHHSIDALVVALTDQSHIKRLNNLNKYLQDELTKRKDEFKIELKDDETIIEAFFNLETTRRKEIQKQIESSRHFEKPFEDLVKQAQEYLQTMVVSHKPKDKLGIIINEKTGKKQLKIRAALHQETYYGKLNGKDTKTVTISKLTAKDISKVIDEVLKKEIDFHRKKYDTMKEAFTGEGLKAFNESRFQRKKSTELKPPVYKVKIWYSAKENEESTLQRIYNDNEKLSVVTGDNYLFLVMEREGKRVFDIASLYDSVNIANQSIKKDDINFKQKIAEDFRITFGERNRIKGKASKNPDSVLFTLQQNELVYLPENTDDPILNFNKEEFSKWINKKENKINFNKRIYKVVKFTGKDCSFLPHHYANSISVPKELSDKEKDELKKKYEEKKIPKKELNYVEYGSYRDSSPFESGENFTKSQVDAKTENKPLKIQDTCVKLQIDWLGNITL